MNQKKKNEIESQIRKGKISKKRSILLLVIGLGLCFTTTFQIIGHIFFIMSSYGIHKANYRIDELKLELIDLG